MPHIPFFRHSHTGGPVRNYGVWAATPIGYRTEMRRTNTATPHIHLFFVDDTVFDRYFTAAINIESNGDDSRLVFWHQEDFHHPITNDLKRMQRQQSFYPLPNPRNSLALDGLDYTRDNRLIPRFPAGGTLLYDSIPGPDNDLRDKMRKILNRAIEDKATMYLFGSQYHDSGNYGIHDIHMNQGSSTDFENGVNQDGAIIVQFDDHWEAVFLAFASQETPTDPQTGLSVPGRSRSLVDQLS